MGTFTRVDKGLIKIKKALESMARDPSYVKIGLLGNAKAKRPKGTLSNADLGIIHEFGTTKLPPRPFMRPSFEAGKPVYLKLLELATKKGIHEEGERLRMLNIIGLKAASDMKAYIMTNKVQPPSEGGREGKTTLIDTGRMAGAITHAVVKKEE